MASERICLVSGANKGIGLAIVRQLALQYPTSALSKQGAPLLIYLTARDKRRGEDALASIHADASLKRAKALAAHGGRVTVAYHALDIAAPQSISELAAYLREKHPDGIDVVVNNAGIAMQGFDSSVVEETLHCNYFGTLSATDTLLPLLRSGGRLVNVASQAGLLNRYSGEVRKRFLAARTRDDVTALMDSFKAAVAAGNEKAEGWPSAAYAVSKAGVIGVTGVIAREHAAAGGSVLINSCCPGYVKTDMTRGGGAKTPDQGAQTPVLLALGDIGGKTGLFWSDEKPMAW